VNLVPMSSHPVMAARLGCCSRVGYFLLSLAFWTGTPLWGCHGVEAPRDGSPALQWLFGDGPLRTFRRRDKHATFIHVQREDPDNYATALPFALGHKLADRIVAAFDRKGKLDDDTSTVLFSRERQMTQAEVKNRRHSHATVSKLLRAVEVHHDSPDFNEFLQRWGKDMQEFLPTSLGVTGVLYAAQPKDTILPPHSDREEGFVLHLEGKKTWRICNKPDSRDHERIIRLYDLLGDWKRPVHDLEDCDEFEMAPGDFLYIPEGCPHYAKNNGERKAAHLNFHTFSQVSSSEL